jgi:hypothetical protein
MYSFPMHLRTQSFLIDTCKKMLVGTYRIGEVLTSNAGVEPRENGLWD